MRSLHYRVSQLEREMTERKNEIQAIQTRNVSEDLAQKRFPGSDKPMYSYDDIAAKNQVNRNFVQKVAEETGQTRRSLKVVQ